MAYKVMKKEHVRQRPKWLVRLLMAIDAQTFEACDTLEEAQTRFQAVYDAIDSVKLFERNRKLCLKEDADELSINSNKGRTYIRFNINKDYYKI